MIVKVQVSIATSEPDPQVLIYSEDRSVWYTGSLTPTIRRRMGEEFKRYFEATVDCGVIALRREVEEQPW